MLGISRWSKEYSYKTIERFFDKKIDWLSIITKTIKLPQLRYFVYDGASFGNNVGIQSVKRAGLYLISKLKKNSSLYFKFEGEQKGRGRKRIYGELVVYQNLDFRLSLTLEMLNSFLDLKIL